MTDTRHNIAILQRWVNSDGTERECARCGETYHLPPSYEASAMCNACAQWFVAEVAPDLLEIAAAAAAYKLAKSDAARKRGEYAKTWGDDLIPGVEAADNHLVACSRRYDAALAKVDP